ncbi:hypothetical protein CRG98_025597, partial [Punica granatum]
RRIRRRKGTNRAFAGDHPSSFDVASNWDPSVLGEAVSTTSMGSGGHHHWRGSDNPLPLKILPSLFKCC